MNTQEICERFEEVSGLTGNDESAILANNGDKSVWGRQIITKSYRQTYLSIQIESNDFIVIDSRVDADAKNSRSFKIGVIDPDKTGIRYYGWSTEKQGLRVNRGSQGFGNKKEEYIPFYTILANKGFPGENQGLPGWINVDQAVTHWLGIIEAAISNPETLKGIDISTEALVGQFRH